MVSKLKLRVRVTVHYYEKSSADKAQGMRQSYTAEQKAKWWTTHHKLNPTRQGYSIR